MGVFREKIMALVYLFLAISVNGDEQKFRQ